VVWYGVCLAFRAPLIRDATSKGRSGRAQTRRFVGRSRHCPLMSRRLRGKPGADRKALPRPEPGSQGILYVWRTASHHEVDSVGREHCPYCTSPMHAARPRPPHKPGPERRLALGPPRSTMGGGHTATDCRERQAPASPNRPPRDEARHERAASSNEKLLAKHPLADSLHQQSCDRHGRAKGSCPQPYRPLPKGWLSTAICNVEYLPIEGLPGTRLARVSFPGSTLFTRTAVPRA